jgi:hypothetical protein
MLETFHPDPGRLYIIGPGDRSMIRQQHALVAAREWRDRRADGRGSWSGVRDQRNFTQEQYQLGEDISRQTFTGHRETGRDRGVGMDDRPDIRAFLIDPQVQI